jgi:hypothetical protein
MHTLLRAQGHEETSLKTVLACPIPNTTKNLKFFMDSTVYISIVQWTLFKAWNFSRLPNKTESFSIFFNSRFSLLFRLMDKIRQEKNVKGCGHEESLLTYGDTNRYLAEFHTFSKAK